LRAYVDRRRILTFGEAADAGVAEAIGRIGRRRGRMTLNKIDGEPSSITALGALLQKHGFAVTPRGLAYRGPK
jgi:hypothetical protein